LHSLFSTVYFIEHSRGAKGMHSRLHPEGGEGSSLPEG
jgi:hypothetical protein